MQRLYQTCGWLTLLALLLANLGTAHAQSLTVHVVGLRNTIGSIRIGFYDSAAQWDTQRSNFQRHGSKALSAHGEVSFTFDDVPAGRYGIAIADDENDNGVMDWGYLLPKEGFGFSNYRQRALSRPAFEQFMFELPATGHVVVVVYVRYL